MSDKKRAHCKYKNLGSVIVGIRAMSNLETWKNQNIKFYMITRYIELGDNTLKSSSTFQLPAKIMFSLKNKILGFFLGRTKQTYLLQNMYKFDFLKTVIGACFRQK